MSRWIYKSKYNSLIFRIYRYMEEVYKENPNTWVHKDVIIDLAKGVGYNSENCARRLRELSEEREDENGKNSIVERCVR